MRDEKGTNSLLGTPAPHLNPTKDPLPPVIMEYFTTPETQPLRSKSVEDPRRGAEGASWRDPGLRPRPVKLNKPSSRQAWPSTWRDLRSTLR